MGRAESTARQALSVYGSAGAVVTTGHFRPGLPRDVTRQITQEKIEIR